MQGGACHHEGERVIRTEQAAARGLALIRTSVSQGPKKKVEKPCCLHSTAGLTREWSCLQTCQGFWLCPGVPPGSRSGQCTGPSVLQAMCKPLCEDIVSSTRRIFYSENASEPFFSTSPACAFSIIAQKPLFKVPKIFVIVFS